jgi:molecular chaperone GrpE
MPDKPSKDDKNVGQQHKNADKTEVARQSKPAAGKQKAETKMAELEKKCEEYLNGWKRAQADYHNLQKEIEQRKSEWIKMASADLLIELLPVYDNLKLALKHVPASEKDSDWVIGVRHIKNQLQKVLDEHGVKEIKTVGEKFNPHYHEAVPAADEKEDKAEGETQKTEKTQSGVIVKEVRPGYLLNDKVLYPAKVVVKA